MHAVNQLHFLTHLILQHSYYFTFKLPQSHCHEFQIKSITIQYNIDIRGAHQFSAPYLKFSFNCDFDLQIINKFRLFFFFNLIPILITYNNFFYLQVLVSIIIHYYLF
jgi:hypothetical protein